jgi:hypothetical protein
MDLGPQILSSGARTHGQYAQLVVETSKAGEPGVFEEGGGSFLPVEGDYLSSAHTQIRHCEAE